MPKQIYPWATWMNGELHVLERGKDFEKEPEALAKSARTYARRFGMKARAVPIGNKVCLQLLDGDETEQENES